MQNMKFAVGLSLSVASRSVLSVGPRLAELNCHVTGAERGHVLTVLQSMKSVLVELTKTVGLK